MQRSPGKSLLGNLKDVCGIKLRCPEMNEEHVVPAKDESQCQPEQDSGTLLEDDHARPAAANQEPVAWKEEDLRPLRGMLFDPQIKDVWEEEPSPTQKAQKEPVAWKEEDLRPLRGMLFDPKIKDLWEEEPSPTQKAQKRLFGDSSDDEDLLFDPEATVVLGDPVPETPAKKMAKPSFK